MKKIMTLTCFLALAGCQTTPINQLSYGEQMKLSAKFEKTCQALGIKPNTPQYQQCFYQEAVAEQARRNENVRRGDNYMKSLNEFNRNQAIQNSPMRPLVIY